MAYLTRANYKTWAGITGTSLDAQIDLLLSAVTTAIKNETQRDFEADEVTQERTYLYDGSGVLEIDDAKNITQVKVVQSGIVLQSTGYQANTQNGKITWLELPKIEPWPLSPEMGFQYNLDQLWWSVTSEPQIAVTATFGWADADVPPDVILAAYWAMASWLSSARSDSDLESESIASYSRSWNSGATAEEVRALPGRSRDLLEPYQRD